MSAINRVNLLKLICGVLLFVTIQGCGNIKYVPPSEKTSNPTSSSTPAPTPPPAPAPAPAPTPAPAPQPNPDVVLTSPTGSFIDARGATWRLDPNYFVARNNVGIAGVDYATSPWRNNYLVFHQADQSVYLFGTNGMWYVYSEGIGMFSAAAAPPITPDPAIFVAPSFVDLKITMGEMQSLITPDGTWTFGSDAGVEGSEVLLNGNPTNGAGMELDFYKGNVYSFTANGLWFQWVSGTWNLVSAPY